jgi:hypothetical protein
MMLLATATDSIPPPPPPIEERRIPLPPQLPPARLGPWQFPGGLSLVAGIGNPEWAHLGLAYRHGHVGGGLSVGSIGLAHNVGAVLRLFATRTPGGPFVEAGATMVQLAETTAGLTPRDLFFQRFYALGWQFTFPAVVVNLSAGIHDPPPRSAAPPGPIITSGLYPRVLAEVGYGF